MWTFPVAAAVLLLDRASKLLALRSLDLGDSISVIGNVFQLTLVTNPGGAFGLFRGQGSLFTALSIATVAVLVLYRKRFCTGSRLMEVSLGLILGGAAGNLVDRLLRADHRVVDFLDLGVGPHRWPVFNLADASICVGVGLIFLFCFRKDRKGSPRDSAGKHGI